MSSPNWPSGTTRPSRSAVIRRTRGLSAATPLMVQVAIGLLAILIVALATLELWSPLDTRMIDRAALLQPPSMVAPFGTDNLGRDMFVWSLHGLRTSLLISAAAAVLAVGLGGVLGGVAGAAGGKVDSAIMRLVDIFASQSHFLFGLLLLVLIRPLLGPAAAVTCAVGLTHWVKPARIIRAELLSLRTRPFIAAAINSGASRAQVAWWHLLPNVAPPLLLAFVLTVPHAVFHETGYSFLGLGMPLETPSLGRVLGLGQANILAGGWWVAVLPGVLLFIAAACIATVGERLRDTLDPATSSELQL